MNRTWSFEQVVERVRIVDLSIQQIIRRNKKMKKQSRYVDTPKMNMLVRHRRNMLNKLNQIKMSELP